MSWIQVVHFKGSRKRLMLESWNFFSSSSDISDMLCLILMSGRTKYDFWITGFGLIPSSWFNSRSVTVLSIDSGKWEHKVTLNIWPCLLGYMGWLWSCPFAPLLQISYNWIDSRNEKEMSNHGHCCNFVTTERGKPYVRSFSFLAILMCNIFDLSFFGSNSSGMRKIGIYCCEITSISAKVQW